jgi:hypothetical protein
MYFETLSGNGYLPPFFLFYPDFSLPYKGEKLNVQRIFNTSCFYKDIIRDVVQTCQGGILNFLGVFLRQDFSLPLTDVESVLLCPNSFAITSFI